MYKITIEETIGAVTKKTTIETDDVDLVKSLLEIKGNVSVDSDVDNLNIDPEWQELMQWYRNKKSKERDNNQDLIDVIQEIERSTQRTKPITITPFSPQVQPYVSPFSQPYDPYSPFTVTC